MAKEPITAKSEDPKLQSIRDVVRQKDDSIPFLLFPVRVETRFMTVDRPVFSSSQVGSELIDSFSDLQFTLQRVATYDPASFRDMTQALTNSLKKAADELEKIDSLTPHEKSRIYQQFQSINSAGEKLLGKLEKARISDIRESALLSGIHNSVNSQLHTLEEFLRVKTVQEHKYADASALLKSLKTIQHCLVSIINKDLTTHIKNERKQIYQFLDNQITCIVSAYQDFLELYRNILKADPSQIEQLEEIALKIQKEAEQFPSKIGGLYSNYKRREYRNKFDDLNEKTLDKLLSLLLKITLPKLKLLQKVPLLDSNELIFRLNSLIYALKWDSHQGIQNVTRIERSRQDIYGQFSSLQHVVQHNIIEGDEQEFKVIHEKFAQLEGELQRYLSLLNRFQPQNPLETREAKKTIQTLRMKVLPIIQDFKNQATKEQLVFTNRDYTNINKIEIIKSHNATSKLQLLFAKRTKTVDELWIRIYPDDIAIHTHEPQLTNDEVKAGKTYWETTWLASGDYNQELGAWRELCAKYGAQRAAWVAKTLTPIIYQILSLSNKATQEFTILFNRVSMARNYGELQISEDMLNGIITLLDNMVQLLSGITEEHAGLLQQLHDTFQESYQFIPKLQRELERIYGTIIIFPSLRRPWQKFYQEIRAKFAALSNTLSTIKPLDGENLLTISPKPLLFPEVETKAAPWTTAPHSNIMPDRFVVLTINEEQFTHITVGNPIPKPLIVGLNPEKFETDAFDYDDDGNLLVDEDIKWMTDFEEALQKGMGFILPLSHNEATQVFEKILVLGIKGTSHSEGKAIVEALFENHHYTDEGFSFLPVGTPTNNTEQGASGYRSIDEDDETSFGVERQERLFDEHETGIFDMADGKRLADALGIEYSIFQHIQHADRKEISHAFLMNRTLWPVTGGYYLQRLLNEIFSWSSYQKTQKYFTENMTGRGLLPSIRIGTQPYGILPTTAFSRFKISQESPQLHYDERLNDLLYFLNRKWFSIVESFVKHADNVDHQNPQEHFMEILGLHPTSVEYFYRYAANCAQRRPSPEDPAINVNWKENDEFGPHNIYRVFQNFIPATRHKLGYTRIFRLRYLQDHAQFVGPIIDDQSSTENTLLSSINEDGWNYIDWLIRTDYEDMFSEDASKHLPSNSLFFLLLRRLRWLVHTEETEEYQLLQYLLLPKLSKLPTAQLERLFAEHLDLCSYRFDAWQLGLANRRLQEQRNDESSRKKGIYIGAFGWVENLAPGGNRKKAVDIPETLSKIGDPPIYTDEDNQGFIHAPSLSHAAAAAILRSGYISNSEKEDITNKMAVNLSSERVRMALHLLDGVRNGHDVGALLGYQFERGLHERYQHLNVELDEYIYPFRKKFPLTTNVDEKLFEADVPEELSIHAVVNGLALLHAVRDNIDEHIFTENEGVSLFDILYDEGNFTHCPGWLFTIIPESNVNELKAVLKEIDRMANAFDALGDVIISESVYQISQGNHTRAAAVTTALAEGRAPSEIQIINTPRSGIVVTHRTSLHFDAVSGEVKPDGWADVPFTPRAFAEPSVNKWFGEIIGNPDNIRCCVDFQCDDTSGTPNNRDKYVSVKDLRIQPLDLVYLVSGSNNENSTEFKSLIAYHARRKFHLSKNVLLTIKITERREEWSENIHTFYQMAPLLNSLHELISNSRTLAADDLSLPGEDLEDESVKKNYDLDELKQRLLDVKTRLKGIRNNLSEYSAENFLEKNREEKITALRQYLLDASAFGIAHIIPASALETSPEDIDALLTIAAEAFDRITERLERAQKNLDDLTPQKTDIQTLNMLREMAQNLFGKDVVILPQFALSNQSELETLVQMEPHESLLRNATHFAMDRWFQSISKVRKKLSTLEMVSILTETFGQEFPVYVPLQLPYREGDYWLGIEYPDDYEPDGDRLSLVLFNPEALLTGDENKVGLFIDEWVEIIPNKEELTGITFNYDQPGATPPQNLLLAITPEETGQWNWDDLVYTLLDTLDLARIRAVEPDHLDKTIFSHLLPSILIEGRLSN